MHACDAINVTSHEEAVLKTGIVRAGLTDGEGPPGTCAELHRDRPRDDGGGYGGDGAAAAPTPFAGDGHEEEETHEADFNELNPAAEAAAREEAAARASARAAPVDHVRRGVQRVAQYDDDDML